MINTDFIRLAVKQNKPHALSLSDLISIADELDELRARILPEPQPVAWQPIETLAKDFELFDVWSPRLGRVADCADGVTTYSKVRGIVYQSSYDINGPVMELVDDATHWMRIAPPGLNASPTESRPQGDAPIDMILYCPNCGKQHVDKAQQYGDYGTAINPANRNGTALWTNPPHRSHLCHDCGCIWRPADVATNGVAEIKTEGKADTWPVNAEEITAASATTAAHGVPDDAEIYEYAIKRAERTFGKNKSRMWVLKILREYIAEGLNAAPSARQESDSEAS